MDNQLIQNNRKLRIGFFFFVFFISQWLHSQVRPAHIFDSNMVLQRDKQVRIWGWASPEENVKIEFGGKAYSCAANPQGEWSVYLDPMTANDQPQTMKITGEKNSVEFSNILIGDVWILGGQSNMEFDLARIFHGDAEVLSANFPCIRLMTIPSSADQAPKKDFERINEYDSWLDRYDKKGYWFICSPSTVSTFSGLGYIFGRRIHLITRVPVGLIDLSLGGTTLEAWLSPATLAQMDENAQLLKLWNDKAAAFDPAEDLKMKIRNWEKNNALRKEQGLDMLPKPVEPSVNPALDRNFPGSSYTGMVAVIAGLTVKGIVFHQGYNNALRDSRPKLYALNFKALIKDWRSTFNEENLSFGIIELSAGGEPQTSENFEVRMLDPAPFIREGQFQAFIKVPNTGFVCTYDQQVNWYHPQKKVEAGERMARWALSTQYGFDLAWKPAICVGVERQKDRIIITFDTEVKSSDDRPLDGFAMAGSDRRFFPAKADWLKAVDDKGKPVYHKKKIEIWNNLVADPVEVRYAWARNPLGNLVNSDARIIPVAPFRTDNWDYPEAPYSFEELDEHWKMIRSMQQRAQEIAGLRIIEEAKQALKKLQVKDE